MTSTPQADPAAVGLTSAEARRLLAEVGPNAIAQVRGPSALHQFLAKLTGLFALLLWAGAALALIAGTPELSAAIVAVILVNAAFSFFQEHRAQRALAALGEILPLRVRVRRDGAVVEVPNSEVVPGDVLVLSPGDRIAGDAELLLAQELRVDESVLTGESEPVSPRERVFAGTYVVAGAAEARVTATGMSTRFGQVAALTQSGRRRRSPLELELDRVTRVIAFLAVATGLAFFLVAGALGIELIDRLVFAIGVTVALVPEGLLPTVTLSLAMATRRMAERKALVKRLSSVETLGETTVICTDKTGTLTRNEMTVQRVWAPHLGEVEVEGAGYEPSGRFLNRGGTVDPTALAELLRAGAACNDARLERRDGSWRVVGDPTEGALLALAAKGGIRIGDALPPRLLEFPFSSERMRMTTVHMADGRRVAYTKGAVEAVLPLTSLDEAARAQVAAAAERMEGGALRVLALARRVLDDEEGRGPRRWSASLSCLGWSACSTRRGPRCPRRSRAVIRPASAC
jgi:magnesium-transporting ATPase (P-type)